MSRTWVLGVDLSGPANTRDTAASWFEARPGQLGDAEGRTAVGDAELVRIVRELASSGRVVVGLDAPLSYNPGGGDRPADRSLRKARRRARLPFKGFKNEAPARDALVAWRSAEGQPAWITPAAPPLHPYDFAC